MLETLIEAVEETLEDTDASTTMFEYASATGRCRGTLTNVLTTLRMYYDDEIFTLK